MKPFPTSAACCFGILFISVSLKTTGSSEVQVVGSADPVVALAGDDVILPCSLKPSVSAEDMAVEWTRLNRTPTEDVHLYRDGRDSYEEQHPSYRGRTSLFHDELKNGNVSLKLTRVTLSDAGSYRCFIPQLKNKTTVQLFVGAVSQPVISIDGTKGWGVVLKCESGGWYPEPEMEWLDSSGSILPSDGPPERNRDSEDLYTVRQHVTVNQTDTNRFTCRVQQPEINHKKETEIHVPDEVFPKSQVGLIVGLITAAVGVLAAVGVYMWRKHKEKKHKKELEELLDEKGASAEEDPSPPSTIQIASTIQIETAPRKQLEEHEKRKGRASSQPVLSVRIAKVITERDEVTRERDELRKRTGQLDEVTRERDELRKRTGQLDEVTRERDELKEQLRKAEETIKTLSTSPGGQQKTQTPSQNELRMQTGQLDEVTRERDELRKRTGQLDEVTRERDELRKRTLQLDEVTRERDELRKRTRQLEVDGDND